MKHDHTLWTTHYLTLRTDHSSSPYAKLRLTTPPTPPVPDYELFLYASAPCRTTFWFGARVTSQKYPIWLNLMVKCPSWL